MVERDASPTVRRRSLEITPTADLVPADDRRHSWASSSDIVASRKRSSKSRIDTGPGSPAVSTSDQENSRTEERRNAQLSRGSSRRAIAVATSKPRVLPRRLSTIESGSEKEATGFLSRLGRILEGSESETERRKRQPVNAVRGQKRRSSVPHRSVDEDSVLSRRASRSRLAAFDKQATGLSSLLNSNPSMLSVVSSLTHTSGTSSGSNSTVTQKSYDKASISKKKKTKDRKPRRVEGDIKRSSKQPKVRPEATSNVFQYLQTPSMVPGTNWATKTATPEGPSPSLSEEIATPMPAPAPVNQPCPSPSASVHFPVEDESDSHTDRFNSDSGISVRSCSPEARDASKQPPHYDSISATSRIHETEAAEHQDGPSEMRQELVQQERRDRSVSRSRQAYNIEYDPRAQRLRDQEEDLRRHVQQTHQARTAASNPGVLPISSPVPPFATPFQYLEPPSHHGMSPAPLYHPQPAPPQQHVAIPQYAPVPMPPPMNSYPPPLAIDNNKTTITGYELIAHKLAQTEMSDSSDSDSDEDEKPEIVPVYRRFEHLNHRVLLHLQDEISELEEELRYVDEQCAQIAPTEDDGSIIPSSRRADARFGGELHFRRTELLGRVYMKLAQYNKALVSYDKVNRIEKAKKTDVTTYADWLDEHAPIESLETDFLDQPEDLLRLPHRSSVEISPIENLPSEPIPVKSEQTNERSTPHPAVFGLPLAVILPLLAFALIDGLIVRLLALSIIGGAEAAIITQTSLVDMLSVQDWMTCASIYFGVMAILAALVR